MTDPKQHYPVGTSNPHESARLHVTGEARYVCDLELPGTLTACIVTSSIAHGLINGIDISQALALPGVHAVLLAKDIPGQNQMGPVVYDEPCLSEKEVSFIGQAIALIAADNVTIAEKASRLIRIDYSPLECILDIPKAIESASFMGYSRTICQGDPEKELMQAHDTLSGELQTGAQEHWYLETQACLCHYDEGEMHVISSTQHPSETQALVAKVLGLKRHRVKVEVSRLGGAFGGKETQANHVACWASLLAFHTRRPVKLVLNRQQDMRITGKRHPFLAAYSVGFDSDGRLQAADIQLYSDGGACLDLSMAILERALFHIDNAYYIPHLKVTGNVCRTHHPPNTAFRGFGAPQAIAVIEHVLEQVAQKLQIDAAEIRRRNFYGIDENHHTHYGQEVEANRLPMIFDRILESSEYYKRRDAIKHFNKENTYKKRGLALCPVKFGVSFTTSFLNQAGALIHIYQDGSVLVSHGGVEMGQGLHTKMRSIAAECLGVPLDVVKIDRTDTSKVPNTSATAASSGSDLNGMAIRMAAQELQQRLAKVAASMLASRENIDHIEAEQFTFNEGLVKHPDYPDKTLTFSEIVRQAYLQQTSLSTTGYFRTPGLHFDKEKGRGHPFHYFAFGMAVSEVEIDVLTGTHRCIRADILHDAGTPINPAIDLGQVCGGFVQGMGWCTTEEVVWHLEGRLLSDSPDTYKIPTSCDIPEDFRITLLPNAPNIKAIRQSKAVGEPPFILGLSVWLAIRDALSAVQDDNYSFPYSLPATYEVILQALFPKPQTHMQV